MQTREQAPKFLKILAFDEVMDAFSENNSEKAFYVLERSTFSEDDKKIIFNLLENRRTENLLAKEFEKLHNPKEEDGQERTVGS